MMGQELVYNCLNTNNQLWKNLKRLLDTKGERDEAAATNTTLSLWIDIEFSH